MMPWKIVTDPFHHLALSALLAAVPILYLFVALAYIRMKGHWAAISGVVIAVLVAIWGYGMPADLAVLATLYGALFGLWPVAWIVITAIFILSLSMKTGQFEIIRNSLAAVTTDRRMQALLIAFSFGAFIEGAAGFGTPVAITAAMLIGLGFNPLYAAGICLVANTAPVAYGAIGIPIIVASQVSGVDQMAISQMVGRTLPFLSVLIPFYLVVLMSGWKKGMEVWPACLVCGGSFAITQWYVSNYIGPMLPDIIASLVSIVCLTIFLHIWHPEESWTFEHEPAVGKREELKYTGGQIFRAWAPFIILSLMVAAWGVKPVRDALDYVALLTWKIPGLHEMVIRSGVPMAAVYKFNILSAAGTAILFAGIFSIPVMGASLSTVSTVAVETVKRLRWPTVTIGAILGFAYIMNYSGMAITLGYAFAQTGFLFPFFAAFLGWLGVFMTGSDTSSNALFGKLQEVTARAIGIDPVITVSANASGGVCGKMISPQSLSVASAAVHLVGREADIFRFTFKHSIILTALIGIFAYLQAYYIQWMVPVYAKAVTAAPAMVAAVPVALSSHTEGWIYLAITVAVIFLVIAVSTIVGQRNVAPRPATVKK
jgi:lactate permease